MSNHRKLMFNPVERIKNNINNFYLYDTEKALKEILKFYLASKKDCFNFFHIPKTGGKFIKKFLKSNLDSKFNAFEHIVKAKWINPNYKVIISIRDPINRFISCYYSDIRNYEKNNIPLSKLGRLMYEKYPTIDSAIRGFINKDKEIGYLSQLGFMSSINYWGEEKHFSKIKNITIIRTEFLKKDLLEFLTNEFDDFDKWNLLMNDFGGESFKQTNKNDYKIDSILRNDLEDFLFNEYKLYNYLLNRKAVLS